MGRRGGRRAVFPPARRVRRDVATLRSRDRRGVGMAAAMKRTSVPGIYSRGSRYTFPYKTPEGRRKWGTAATIAEAKVKRAALMTDVARGEYRALSKVTFAQYAREWIDTYGGRTKRGIQAE